MEEAVRFTTLLRWSAQGEERERGERERQRERCLIEVGEM
jgi:hypothetical protein